MESLLVYLGDGDTIKENAALLSGKECWSLSGLQVIGAVFGALLEEERAFLYGAGAQTLIEITENETSYWKADTRAKILTDLLKQNKGTLLFLGDTIQEREIGARVCAAMGWPGWIILFPWSPRVRESVSEGWHTGNACWKRFP